MTPFSGLLLNFKPKFLLGLGFHALVTLITKLEVADLSSLLYDLHQHF